MTLPTTRRMLVVTTVSETLRAFLLPFAYHYRLEEWWVDAFARGVQECPECREAFSQVWEASWCRNPLFVRSAISTVRRIRHLVENEKYDLVHVHTPVAGLVTRFALRNVRKSRGLRVIYTAHGFHFYDGGNRIRNAVFLLLEKMAGKWTDYIVVINREDEAAARRYGLVAPDRIRYMPGIGVDTKKYHRCAVDDRDVQRFRESLGLGLDECLFVMVAEFIPRKDHETAMRAFSRFSRDGKAHLALAGIGPLQQKLRALASQFGISDRVHFLGFRDDVPVVMRAATAVVSASKQEGLPRNIMEALSLEVPVIGTDIRGTRELLSGGCGLLVPPSDPVAMAEAMSKIASNPSEALAMARRGRIRMEEEFELSKIIECHDLLYAEVLGLPNLHGERR